MAELQRREVRGWEVLRLSTDALVADVLPGLGGTIWSLTRRADGAELLWAAPWGLPPAAHPRGRAPARPAVDTSPGGWQTLFPNGGDSVSVHGVEWGFDGEARTTFCDWEFTGSSLVMTGRLARSPFEISKIISLRGHEVTRRRDRPQRGRRAGRDHVGQPAEPRWRSARARYRGRRGGDDGPAGPGVQPVPATTT